MTRPKAPADSNFDPDRAGFSRVPPAAKIAERLSVDDDTARRIRRILKGKEDPRTVDATDRWVRQCYNDPRWSEQAEHAADALLGTCGVEACFASENRTQPNGWPEFSYCNTGDSYAATLVFDHRAGAVVICGWADQLEHCERQGIRFD